MLKRILKNWQKFWQQKGFIVNKNPEDRRKACIFPTAKTDRYFKETFSVYQKELKYLFEVYTEDENPSVVYAADETV